MAWRAFQSAMSPKLWGVESNDPSLVDKGDEIIIPPRLDEDVARLIVRLSEFSPPAALAEIMRE